MWRVPGGGSPFWDGGQFSLAAGTSTGYFGESPGRSCSSFTSDRCGKAARNRHQKTVVHVIDAGAPRGTAASSRTIIVASSQRGAAQLGTTGSLGAPISHCRWFREASEAGERWLRYSAPSLTLQGKAPGLRSQAPHCHAVRARSRKRDGSLGSSRVRVARGTRPDRPIA